MSEQNSDSKIWHSSIEGGSGEHVTSFLDQECFYDETLDIQTLKNGAYHTQHIFPYFFFDTMFVKFRIGSYFIGPEYSKIFTSFTFVIFKQYLCVFNRIFEGIYMSCRLTSSFVVFNANFGASILSGTLHSTSPSLKTRLCFYLFFIPWKNGYCCSYKSVDVYGRSSSN